MNLSSNEIFMHKQKSNPSQITNPLNIVLQGQRTQSHSLIHLGAPLLSVDEDIN